MNYKSDLAESRMYDPDTPAPFFYMGSVCLNASGLRVCGCVRLLNPEMVLRNWKWCSGGGRVKENYHSKVSESSSNSCGMPCGQNGSRFYSDNQPGTYVSVPMTHSNRHKPRLLQKPAQTLIGRASLRLPSMTPPPNSSDLKPNEHLWGHIDGRGSSRTQKQAAV